MRTLARLQADQTGAMAVETAIVAPILLMLSLGGVEAGSMVARQSELQSAAAEALNIAIAAPPGTAGERDAIASVLRASTGITGNNVQVLEIWRCGTDADFERDAATDCGSAAVSTYIEITLTETYTPRWTAFGIGSPVTYNVVRQVQVS